MRKEKILILISGPHASGKTTIAKAIAEEFGLRYISAGEIFRSMARERGMDLVQFTKYVEENPDIDYEIDNRMIEEMRKGNVVVDSQLAYFFSQKIREEGIIRISMMIYADLERRIQRLMKREGLSREEAIEEIRIREESERNRFKKLYGVDLWALDDFDIIVNTSHLTIDEAIGLCISITRALLQIKKGNPQN